MDKFFEISPYSFPGETEGVTHYSIPVLAKSDTGCLVGGPASLLKSKSHPSYCQLYITDCITKNGDLKMHFRPLFDDDGNYIFIKWPYDIIESFIYFDIVNGETVIGFSD